jgi:hypothetical protein
MERVQLAAAFPQRLLPHKPAIKNQKSKIKNQNTALASAEKRRRRSALASSLPTCLATPHLDGRTGTNPVGVACL